MTLQIFTLNWNGEEKLKKLYNSLMPSLKDVDYVWTIKDNDSKDSSKELIKSWQNPNIHLIEYKNNLQNFAEGMNYCFDHAKPADDDFVLLLNNDVVVVDDKSIKNMIDLFKQDSVGLVGARLLYTNTSKIQHCGVCFDPRNGYPFHLNSNIQSGSFDQKNREFQAVTGAVWLTKAKFYKEICKTNKSNIGGLDESYIWGFEDIDGCLAIKYNMNKKVIYCGDSKFYHEESATLKKNPQHKLFLKSNLNIFSTKWRGRYIIDANLYKKDSTYKVYKL